MMADNPPAAGDLPEWGFEETSAAFEVNPDDLSTQLGAGAFGAVFSARLHEMPVAAKTLHSLMNPAMYGLVGPNADREAVAQILTEFNAEAEALAVARHPNILRFCGVCYARTSPNVPRLPKWIVTELQPASLHHFVRKTGMQAALGYEDIVLLSWDIADGLAYLHSIGIIHRDLKPKNVLVGPGGAKLADLGTAKMIGIAQRTAQHTVGPGTAIYHPREVLDGRYTDSVDVFSLGLTMEEIILCESPRREGAADPINAEQHQRAVAAHPLMEHVIQRCIVDHDARGSSAEVVEALAALAVAPNFLAGSLDGSHQEESRSWMETVQRDALRELIDGVTRRRRALAWRKSAETVAGELLTARAEVERVTNEMRRVARQQTGLESESELEPEPAGPPPTCTASRPLGPDSAMRPTQSSADASQTHCNMKGDGGLDQSSAFHGVTVFTRPTTAAAEPDAPSAATTDSSAGAGVADDEGVGTPDTLRRPVRGDRVTVCKHPRNTDFLLSGQVGTVVDIDDMDVEDVWFSVEDADGETDEYCEADLVIAGANVVAGEEDASKEQLHTIVLSGIEAEFGSIRIGAALDRMQKTQSSTGTADDWRDSITTSSILAALKEVGNIATTPSKDRVMDAPREIRIYNLTDNPLMCQIVDFDGANVNGGRMLVPGWSDGSIIALGRNGAPIDSTCHRAILVVPGCSIRFQCAKASGEHFVGGDSTQQIVVENKGSPRNHGAAAVGHSDIPSMQQLWGAPELVASPQCGLFVVDRFRVLNLSDQPLEVFWIANGHTDDGLRDTTKWIPQKRTIAPKSIYGAQKSYNGHCFGFASPGFGGKVMAREATIVLGEAQLQWYTVRAAAGLAVVAPIQIESHDSQPDWASYNDPHDCGPSRSQAASPTTRLRFKTESPRPPSALPVRIGDPIEVWSVSTNAWVRATIDKLLPNNDVRAVYGDRFKRIALNDQSTWRPVDVAHRPAATKGSSEPAQIETAVREAMQMGFEEAVVRRVQRRLQLSSTTTLIEALVADSLYE